MKYRAVENPVKAASGNLILGGLLLVALLVDVGIEDGVWMMMIPWVIASGILFYLHGDDKPFKGE